MVDGREQKRWNGEGLANWFGGGGGCTAFGRARAKDELDRLTKAGEGGRDPPWTPSPQTKGTIAGKTKFTVGKIWSGHFWCTNLWVPSPPLPPLLLCSDAALGEGPARALGGHGIREGEGPWGEPTGRGVWQGSGARGCPWGQRQWTEEGPGCRRG